MDIEDSRTLGIDKFINQYNLDAIIYSGSSGAGIGAKAGYPSIIVPAGYLSAAQNLSPLGITFLGEAYTEPKLIGYAYAFEQATLVRKAPSSTPALAGESIGVPEPANIGGIVLGLVGLVGFKVSRKIR